MLSTFKMGAVLKGAIFGLSLAGARYSAVQAAVIPSFTLNPQAVGLIGQAFTATSLVESSYSTVQFLGTGGLGVRFREDGVLPVVNALNGGLAVNPVGLGSTYSLYFQFSATGSQNSSNVTGNVPTFGTFDTLTYTLYARPGRTTYSAGTPYVSSTAGRITLATGTLIAGTGTVVTLPNGKGKFAPTASADSMLTIAPGQINGVGGFFQAPVPFFTMQTATFNNPSTTVTLTRTGFTITQGGGATNFIPRTVVPEPASLGVLGLGLAAVAHARRRRAS